MLIRIRYQDKPLGRQVAIEFQGSNTLSARNPKACNMKKYGS